MPIPVYNNAHTLSLSPHRAYRKGPKIRLCKSLKIKGHFSQKIQGTYFKISALYFKIYALCFLQDALCVFRCPHSASQTYIFCGNRLRKNQNKVVLLHHHNKVWRKYAAEVLTKKS